ncbi:MAG TPA: hypothetical protein VMT61_03360 [Candidatus Binataceae bacterium]|nr:hypothetical protein [Candidatus Binataceae bacterium]
MPRSKLLLLLFLLSATSAGCTKRALPEAGTPAAQLYAERCGACHQAWDPRSMTAEMWRIQVDAMMPKLAAAGTALSEEDKATIVAYLKRNAGHL